MIRRITAFASGFILAFAIILLFEQIIHILYPLPPGIDINDSKVLAILLQNAPVGALLIVGFGYLIASMVGGLVVALIANQKRIQLSLLLGMVLLIAGLINLFTINHPLWFAITSTLVYLPSAWCGGRLGIILRPVS